MQRLPFPTVDMQILPRMNSLTFKFYRECTVFLRAFWDGASEKLSLYLDFYLNLLTMIIVYSQVKIFGLLNYFMLRTSLSKGSSKQNRLKALWLRGWERRKGVGTYVHFRSFLDDELVCLIGRCGLMKYWTFLIEFFMDDLMVASSMQINRAIVLFVKVLGMCFFGRKGRGWIY